MGHRATSRTSGVKLPCTRNVRASRKRVGTKAKKKRYSIYPNGIKKCPLERSVHASPLERKLTSWRR
ncbi:hypothetical protein D918_09834 [Trichuris suis]|nr:hypothetical protein D918_09834 [Trichuris suis]